MSPKVFIVSCGGIEVCVPLITLTKQEAQTQEKRQHLGRMHDKIDSKKISGCGTNPREGCAVLTTGAPEQTKLMGTTGLTRLVVWVMVATDWPET